MNKSTELVQFLGMLVQKHRADDMDQSIAVNHQIN